MKTIQKHWTEAGLWNSKQTTPENFRANLVLVFGGRNALSDPKRFEEIQQEFPAADVISCSTAGEIIGNEVFDESISLTAIQFQKTQHKSISVNIEQSKGRYQAGALLAKQLTREDLRAILVFSEGKNVNGSELVIGFRENLPAGIPVTGGLAGDGVNFVKTVTGLNAQPQEGNIVAVGLYGDSIQVGYGQSGGWKPFGPYRKVSKVHKNELFELDGASALALYKSYLGDRASELPGSGLLFPLAIHNHDQNPQVVRTLLDVNEERQSLTFAGDIPVNSQVQFMMANVNDLVDGASAAAEKSQKRLGELEAEVAILVSCVGRKLIMDQRVEEEVEVIQEILGEKVPMTGFYSYGEISPGGEQLNCELYNQTMSITTLAEK